MDPNIYTLNMNETQRAWFASEYERLSKDEFVGFLLAFFLGSFGAHHFYLRRTSWGVFYALMFWTGIPGIIGFIESFFMFGRVRDYNAAIAAMLRATILNGAQPPITFTTIINTPPAPVVDNTLKACPACGSALDPAAAFCTHCGARTAAA